MNLPIGWERYHEISANFFTYYGDIYPGYIYEFNEFPDSFFIIPQINRGDLIKIKRGKIEIEQLRKIGWEIKDSRIITRIVEGRLSVCDSHYNNEVKGIQIWKQMFVFGAGASSYCMPKSELGRRSNFEFNAPLGNQLFDKKFKSIIDRYEGAKISQPNLYRFNSDVEAYLESEWNFIRNEYNPKLLKRHISIIHYLQELFDIISNEVIENFSDCNLYTSFADRLQKKLASNRLDRVALVNFNYDTILDHYLTQVFGNKFQSINDYINCNDRQVLYFKPHGSCNWGWQYSQEFIDKLHNDTPTVFYNNETTLDTIYYDYSNLQDRMIHRRAWSMDNKYSINRNEIQIVSHEIRHFFPAMLIPYRDKDEFVFPYDHYDRMRSYVAEMEDLFLIGWKGNEAAFNKLVKDNSHKLKRIIIVNPNPNEVEQHLEVYLGKLSDNYEVTYLDDFESLITSELF